MTGTSISQYNILDKLGDGGTGEVYKAEDPRHHRTVVLKFLPPELTRDEDAYGRFMKEADAASALEHPNIGTIHAFGAHEGKHFIAMDFYAGGSLKELIDKGPLTVEDALFIAHQIARGLSRAHARGIIHHDIKPSNIVLTEEGHIKIIDFGLATLHSGLATNDQGSTAGTIAYRSPEQTRGEEVDHRSDLWALGVILYEMLTGDLPFKGKDEQAVIYAILYEEPNYPEDLPPSLKKILQKCLAKDLDTRYQHGHEMSQDLVPPTEGLNPPPELESFVPERPSSLIYLLVGGALATLLLLAWFFRS